MLCHHANLLLAVDVFTKGLRASDMHSVQANSPSVASNSAPDPPELQGELIHADEDCLGKCLKKNRGNIFSP